VSGAVDQLVAEPAPHTRPALSRDALGEVLRVAMRAGQIMLENGANTARVEETVHRIGTALGAEWLDVYVTPTGIIASALSHGEHRTITQRVVKSAIDLSRIAAVLEVSRAADAGTLAGAEVRAALERIAGQPRVYGRWSTALAVAIGCACFAALFGAGPRELLATLLAAGLAQLARERIGRLNIGRLLITGAVAVIAAGLALMLATLLETAQPALVLLASELLLVPGVLMVSSVADLFRGDTISGLARATNAFLVLGAISAGIWTVLLATGMRTPLAPGAPPPLAAAAVLATVAAGGFAVLFDVPRRALWVAALVGGLAYGARQGALLAGGPPEAAIFVGGVVIGVLSELLARALRQPTMLFSIPGFIPLVPGSAAFRTLLEFVGADYAAGTASLVRTALLTAALAAGLGTVNALARIRQRQLF
jgi:uncharacterized membrane protein YjjP (DUF1212 family)